MKNKKIIFMGTPLFAKVMLQSLIDNNYNVIAVVTQPDKKVGRKKEIVFSDVKNLAIKNDINVIQPIKIKDDIGLINNLNADLVITAAYGQIIPDEILNHPTHGAINVHGSLLPKYRGGAPIHYAILNGDKKTGVTIMRMVKKMDAGNIISQSSFEIKFEDTLHEVYDNMSIVGSELLIKTIPLIFNNEHKEIIQNESLVTYAYNISREDELLDFNCDAIDVYNKIRAFNMFPTSYFKFNEESYKVYSATYIENINEEPGTVVDLDNEGIVIACKTNAIKLIEFQPQNKKRMLVKDYLNGNNKFNKNTIVK